MPPTQPTLKTRTSPKRGWRNIDDTNTESDNDDSQQVARQTSSWIEEWKLYINMYEVVPDDMGVVKWWGVSSQCCHVFPSHSYAALRPTEEGIQFGNRSHMTIWPLWPLQSLARGCSPRQEL